MTKFQIGDTVYQASAGQEQVWVTCPECCGSGRLRVILGDDSEVSVDCVCCERGYEGSPGKIQTYQFESKTTMHTITGMEVRKGSKTRYYFGCSSTEEDNLFSTRDMAASRAEQLILEHQVEEKKRLGYKEKRHKTWAWNVTYWKREIRRCKEQIESYESRLAVAPKNPKAVDAAEKEESNG